MLERWEGYGCMHFMYKLDNLFQSIRISYGNSSVTKGLHFLILIWTPEFLCTKFNIQSHIIIFQSFLTSFVIFMHLLIILSYKTLKLTSISNELWKRLKVGMVSSFHPHSVCKKVERVTAKTGCTSCTKRTISFEVSGFHMETRLLQRDFIF